MSVTYLTMDELNKSALEQFVYQPVNREMISYLSTAAQKVIQCDPVPPRSQALPSPPSSPESDSTSLGEPQLPSLEEFITQLVVSSNVQVPTLMASLVYLNRLRSKLQPQARGIRCTTHRIFLASLILAAKYLNDSSPKNKHWASYTNMATDCYHFGFNRQEVNTMEKQLLFLLEWDLRINEHDLYRELDFFLAPIRRKIGDRHARKVQEREDKRRQEMQAAAARYPSPASSRGRSSRQGSPAHYRSTSGDSITPPGLSYSSSASSYASSLSSRQGSRSRSNSPEYSSPESYSSTYDSPVEIVADYETAKPHDITDAGMLPYEITSEQYHQIQDDANAKKPRTRRGVWGRILGTARY